MGIWRAGVGVVLAMAVIPGAVQARTAVASERVQAPFVSPAFAVPVHAQGAGFQLVPLGPDLVRIDYAAYMSSIAHIQKTFTRSTAWPHAGISDDEAMQDMLTEQARFRSRASFAYAVLTPDGTRELGCVYVRPSPVDGYDAQVRFWVTQDQYEAGFEDELYAWVRGWMARDWPFTQVAYPGHAIAWEQWDALQSVRAPR